MKRLLWLCLLFSLPAFGAITRVNASNSGTNATCHATATSTGVACTITTSTLGNDVLLHIGWHTTTSSIKKVVGSNAAAVFVPYSQQFAGSGTTGSANAWWVCRNCPALTSVTPTFSTATKYEITALEYSGVTWIGIDPIATGTSTTPGFTTGASTAIPTGDANDFVVCGVASVGTSGVPTAGNGSLVKAAQTGSTTSDVSVGVVETSSVSPASVQCNATITSKTWSAAALELRTTAPKSYIWPDCDSTHPCVIHHRDPPAIPQSGTGYGPNFYFWFQQNLANNLVKLTITHPNAESISSISVTDVNEAAVTASFSNGPSAVGASYTTDIRYICGATAGMYRYQIVLSGAIGTFDIMHVSYDEISGIATSSCSDGSNTATAQAAGGMAISTTTVADGDLIYTFGIDGTGNQTNWMSGIEQPDDVSAKLFDSSYENFMDMVSVQTTHGATSSKLYASGMDVNHQNTWQLVQQAFKASNGAGTQPAAGKAVVVSDLIEWNNISNPNAWVSIPTYGNALVVDTTHFQTLLNMTTLKDNYGSSFTNNTVTDTGGDPQQMATCFGATTINRDRVVTYTANASSSTILHVLVIAGAKKTGVTGGLAGTSGCVGAMANHKTGNQAGVVNSNVVTSTFGTPWSFSPTLNSTAYSVVQFDMGFGAGPPSFPCKTGGVTPPTCTGDMTNITEWDSIFADNNTDASHYTTGDAFAYYVTNSTSAMSLDAKMNNATNAPAGGTGAAAAAIEIFGEPAAAPPATPAPKLLMMNVGGR